MKTYTVTISDEEEKALLTDMVSIQIWLDNAIHNKARQVIDKIVLENSDKQPSKIPETEKLQIIRDATLETAAERTAREEKLMLGKKTVVEKHRKRKEEL